MLGPQEEKGDSYTFHLNDESPSRKLLLHHKRHQARLPKEPGIMDLPDPGMWSTYVYPVVHNTLRNDGEIARVVDMLFIAVGRK